MRTLCAYVLDMIDQSSNPRDPHPDMRGRLRVIAENPDTARLPLIPFADVERRLVKVRRALARAPRDGVAHRLLLEEAQLLEQDLAARPFNPARARRCEQELLWRDRITIQGRPALDVSDIRAVRASPANNDNTGA